LSNFGIVLDSEEQWARLKFTSKKELGVLKIPKEFSELRITSGSTGKPLYMFYSEGAVKSFINRTIISLKKSRVTRNDTVLNLFAYGNYVPGSMYERACNKLHIKILPLGAPNTYPAEKVVEVILKIRPSVWFSVPSYALKLLESVSDSNCRPKKVIVAGERLLDSYIERFRHFNVEVINHFGLTECPAIGISDHLEPKTIKVINSGIYVEAKEETDGQTALVITDLNNTSTPIIRYKTGDIIKDIKYMKDGTVKEFAIVGRDDHLIKLQGILISKGMIIDRLSKYTNEFMVKVKTVQERDFVEVVMPKQFNRKAEQIYEDLSFVSAKKEIIFSDKLEVLYKTDPHKLRRIIDERA